MSASNPDAFLLPRPVERLPDYAHAKARQTLAERLVDAFHLSRSAADTVANGVVDPSEVRKAIGDPDAPEVERIAVPGGTILGIRTQVWARRVLPDPRNPRLLPSRRHPFAVDPGTGGEDAKFRPVPEPRSPEGVPTKTGELVVDVESRHHLNWACQQAASFVLVENDWRDSIKNHGVMEAVWLVATTYLHADDTKPVTALVTAEGSSRTTAAHDILGVRSADVPYDENEAKLRAYVRKLNDSYQRGPSPEDIVALRCERMPALILVGFEPYEAGGSGFSTAVKSLVALRHVDPPKPWGDGPENESLADEVLDEFYRRNLISSTQRDYFGGSCTRSEARAAHLSDDAAVRAAQIVRLFATKDERFVDAIRMAVTSQSTRKRITSKLLNELATALILRAMAENRERTDQVRRYLRHAFGPSVHSKPWDSTDRDIAQLTAAALTEVRTAIGDDTVDEPGPASIELAVRGAYALVVSGRLNADRGTANNDQPDRRTPGQVLDTMRCSVQGVYQLGQAVKDFSTDGQIRAVDEDGSVRRLHDGTGDLMVNDVFLRGEFPPPGNGRAPRPGDTPLDRYHNRMGELASAVAAMRQAFVALVEVVGDDGRALVETKGVDLRMCNAWRDTLDEMRDELVVWARTFKRNTGVASTVIASIAESDDDSDIEDGACDSDAVDAWDAEAETTGT